MVNNKIDETVIKLLHYFITVEGYNPIILHGAKDEIWLEKLDSKYTIIRLCSNYIHNSDQLEFDFFKTSKIMEDIKKKTYSFKINLLNIFLNFGETVVLEDIFDEIKSIHINNISELKNIELITETFPDIVKKTKFKEKGIELFSKITEEIGKKNEEDNKMAEDVFAKKVPYVTYTLIVLNVLIFIASFFINIGYFSLHDVLIKEYDQYYRFITSGFFHADILHLGFNMYALYIIGSQIEGFFGRNKYLLIYFGSLIISGLFSLLFVEGHSIGASGAIFGLLGSLLIFSYHYRLYFGSILNSEIIPIIVINLGIGFMIPGINNYAHIGGLIGGILLTKAVGVKYKTDHNDSLNGIILSVIFVSFLIYLNFFI